MGYNLTKVLNQWIWIHLNREVELGKKKEWGELNCFIEPIDSDNEDLGFSLQFQNLMDNGSLRKLLVAYRTSETITTINSLFDQSCCECMGWINFGETRN